MSETTTEAADTATEATETEPDLSAEVEKWKSLAKKHEARAKDNADKAKRFDEIEESSKSELEKATARAEAAEKALATARLDSDRASVALSKGLTPTQAKRLVGTTREELEADADDLLADLKASSATPPRAPDQKRTTTSAAADDEREFVKNLFGRR